MLKLSVLLFICYFFTCPIVHSQTITGQVLDSIGTPITFASVVATNCQQDQVLAFVSTDDQGKFKIEIRTDCDSITLTARSLGYQTVMRRLAVRDLPATQVFELANATLQEVIVRGKTPPIVARNDTTEYNVASFSDSTEVSVEDLLKKLPGVRVSENGLITYNGKTVERVMIDGDDLFSQNYTLATRNIRADMISKVQVIDRFQENPLMKGIEESDRMVMNLKIKPERKRSLSGSAELGAGYGDEWKGKAHTSLFSLSRKEKIYLIGDANNAGDNALSDVEWTAGGGMQNFGKPQTLQANPLQVHEVIQNPSLESVGLPPIYTQANRSGLIYLGLVLPSSNTIKTKISGWAGEMGLKQRSGNSTRYLLGTDMLDISENKSVRKLNRTCNVQAESEYFSLDKKHALRAFVKVGSKPTGYNLDLLRRQTQSDPLQVISQLDQRSSDVFGSFEYTFKQRESAAFQIISKTAWHRGQSLLQPQYNWYALFFGLDSPFTHVYQTTMQQQGQSVFMGRWLARVQEVQWQAEAGMDWTWQHLESNMRLENHLGETWNPGEAYQNDTRLQSPRYFANLSATRTFGRFLTRASVGTSYRSIGFESAPNSNTRQRFWAVEPRLDLRYAINERAVISSYYGFQQDLPSLADLRPGYIFTDYQLTARGVPDLSFLPGHQAGLVYRYNNRISQFSWNISGGTSQYENQFGTAYQINPFLTVQEKFRPVTRVSYTANGGVDRYFSNIHSRFEIGFGCSVLQEKAKLNSETPANLTQQIYAVNLGYGTAFDTWVNVVLSSRSAQILGRSAPGSPATRSENWFSTAQISVKPNKIFDLKIFVHQVANRAESNSYNIAYASDCVAYLRLDKRRSIFGFSAVNLLGSNQYEQVLADAFYQNTTTVLAVKRFFILSWERSF